jgi:serine/threonine protein kinase
MHKLLIEVGTTIRSLNAINYRIVQSLGAGGNSLVYLALALNGEAHGVLFALKVFTRVSKPKRLERFQQEAEFLRKCTHPSIMRIYDNGVYHPGTGNDAVRYPFVIVDYLPETLDQAMRKPMTTAERVSYTLQLLSALCYLEHYNPPIVHRDIKPKNIFVKGRSCVLGDFGLMKFLDGERETKAEREIYRQAAGPGMPYAYRSPDLVAYAKGEGDLSAKSDVFQLGLVIAEMFTGVNPSRRPKTLLEPVRLLGVRHISCSVGLTVQSLIQKMLLMDPPQRPSAVSLLDPWEGIFREVVSHSHQLNGRVF